MQNCIHPAVLHFSIYLSFKIFNLFFFAQKQHLVKPANPSSLFFYILCAFKLNSFTFYFVDTKIIYTNILLLAVVVLQWVLELHGFKLHGFEQHWVSEKSKKYCTTRNPWATRIIMNQFVLIYTRNTWAARNTELYNMFFKYKIQFGMKNALEI